MLIFLALLCSIGCCSFSKLDDAIDQMFPEMVVKDISSLDQSLLHTLNWLDELSLWNLGLVDKRTGRLVRSKMSRLLKDMPDKKLSILRILAKSELDLHDWMTPFFGITELEKAFGFSVHALTDYNDPKEDKRRYIRSVFVPRAKSLKILRFFYTGRFRTSDDIPLPFEIASDLYHGACDMGVFQHWQSDKFLFYLPITDKKLFDIIDPILICQVHWSDRDDLNQMFMPALMRDYIIPCMRDELVLNERERYIFRVLMKYRSWIVTPYFDELYLAGRFDTDGIKAKINLFVKQLGSRIYPTSLITNSALKFLQVYINDRHQRDRSLEKMFAIALQTGMDLKKVAKLAHFDSPHGPLSPLNLMIQAGNIPGHVLEMSSMDIRNICRLCYNIQDLFKLDCITKTECAADPVSKETPNNTSECKIL